MTDAWNTLWALAEQSAFTLWGAPTTWLELVAVVLALVMVGCNIREIHWGWPLAILSSLLYGELFWRNRLYGDAALQGVFVVVAFWGWWQWLRGTADDGSKLHVQALSRRGIALAIALTLAGWPLLGYFLAHQTDSPLPYWDALPTVGSVLGTWLGGRKYVENWATWIAVNLFSTGLFAYKGYWLTVVLYAIFIPMSVVGWRAWRRMLLT